MRRLAIGLVSGALIIAACGDDDTEPAADTVAPTEAPAATDAVQPEPDAAAPEPDVVEEPAPEPEPVESNSDAAEPEPESEPEPTTTLAPEPAPAPLGGRELGAALRPESTQIANPLPDLVVDDVGRGMQANVANILPSQRPVLVWAWAPH